MVKWIKKEKKIFSDWTTAVTFIVITLFTIINIIASLIPDLNKYFTDNNMYVTFGWVVVLLILTNIHSMLKFISNLGTCHSYEASDISEVIYKFKKYTDIKIFFGLDTFHIWEIISTKQDLAFNNLEIYFDPSIIQSYKNPLFKFNNLDVYFADIPRNYIYISGRNDGCELCNLIIDSNDSLSVIDLSKKNGDTQVFDNLFTKMTENNKISLTEELKAQALYFLINKSKESSNQLICEQYVALANRNEFLNLATILVKKAKQSLYAIDFIGPQFWTNEHDNAFHFGEAHKVEITGDKKRIHIYDFENFDKKYPNLKKEDIYKLYIKYIDFMEEKGVNISFLPAEDFDLKKYEKRGSLIIDGKSVIVAINPENGATFGEVTFKKIDIENYQLRFNEIAKIAKSKDDFITKLTKRYL
jgi:hypothetical protein